MTSNMCRWLGRFGAAALLVAGIGCGDDGQPGGQLCGDEMNLVDDDLDFIPNTVEGFLDDDLDGVVNFFDLDSDNDGILDLDEGSGDCDVAPPDLDLDGLPDFRDPDGNGDGRIDTPDEDGVPIETETCGQADPEPPEEPLERVFEVMGTDGTPDYQQDDLDNDGIKNWDEIGLDGLPFDSDRDCIPDVWDPDSDNDGVPDSVEGPLDFDGDGFGNFRDLDSDGDGIADADEVAEDGTPIFCDMEIDPGFDPEVMDEPELDDTDTLPDYLDRDSDNDGLTDGEESLFGTDLCNWDSDGDGQSDLVESVYERVNCPDGPDAPGAIGCGCAADPECSIPDTDFFVVLPFNGRAVTRSLSFASDVLAADVMLMVSEEDAMDDINFSQRLPLRHFTESFEDLIEATRPATTDTWFGFASWNELPITPYAETRFSNPNLLRLFSPIKHPDDYTSENFTTISNLTTVNGNQDRAAGHTEAIFQVLSDLYTTYSGNGNTFGLDPMNFPDCDGERDLGPGDEPPPDVTFGKACFRRTARPIIVQVAMNCAHQGPPGNANSCPAYTNINPSPVNWDEMIFEMNRRGAKYIGVNTLTGFSNRITCGVGSPVADGSPCYYMFNTGLATGSTNEFGDALLYDHTARDEAEDFVANVAEAVRTVVTRAPIDVDTSVRDDPSDFVDAGAFIRQRAPSCSYDPVMDGGLPAVPCWTPPEGLSVEEAVALVDQSTFFDILPGTSVDFDVTFQNLTVPGDDVARAYVAAIELRADRRNLVSSRQVIVIVPAGSGQGGPD